MPPIGQRGEIAARVSLLARRARRQAIEQERQAQRLSLLARARRDMVSAECRNASMTRPSLGFYSGNPRTRPIVLPEKR